MHSATKSSSEISLVVAAQEAAPRRDFHMVLKAFLYSLRFRLFSQASFLFARLIGRFHDFLRARVYFDSLQDAARCRDADSFYDDVRFSGLDMHLLLLSLKARRGSRAFLVSETVSGEPRQTRSLAISPSRGDYQYGRRASRRFDFRLGIPLRASGAKKRRHAASPIRMPLSF